MSNRYAKFPILILLLATFAWPDWALAQAARRDESGTARLQAMINRLTAEKAALERENARLAGDLRKAESDAETLEAEESRASERVQALEAALARYQESNTRANGALEQTRARMEELVVKFRETVETLRQTEVEKADVGRQLDESREDYLSCARANVALYETGMDALAALEDRGVFKRLSTNEPFTQIGRVRLENLVDEYRIALEDDLLGDVAVDEDS